MSTGRLRAADYIPHKPPMRLVENVLEAGRDGVVAVVDIDSHCAFYDRSLGGVPAWVGLEYMAQAAGVWAGVDDVRQGRPVELSFLVSAREYQADVPVFRTGSRILIAIEARYRDGTVVTFDGDLRDGAGGRLATARFTAYRPDDVQRYLGRSPTV